MHGRALLTAEGLGNAGLARATGDKRWGGGPACPGLCSTRCSILPYACLAAGCSAPCRHALSSLHLQDGSRQEQKCLCCTFSLQSHPSCPRLRIHDPASPGKTHPEGPIGEPAPLGGGTGPRAVPTQGCLLPSLLQPAPPPPGQHAWLEGCPQPCPQPQGWLLPGGSCSVGHPEMLWSKGLA